MSGFPAIDWRDHFDMLKNGAIMADTQSRALHFWSEDGANYRLFPKLVPRSPELTRLGYTRIRRKVDGTSWSPTPSMRERDPSLSVTMGPGPDNLMETHALHLS